jgi:hypothetical protein
MNTAEFLSFFVALALSIGVMLLYHVLRRLDLILYLLQRSLPLNAVALVPPPDEDPLADSKPTPIHGFRPGRES